MALTERGVVCTLVDATGVMEVVLEKVFCGNQANLSKHFGLTKISETSKGSVKETHSGLVGRLGDGEDACFWEAKQVVRLGNCCRHTAFLREARKQVCSVVESHKSQQFGSSSDVCACLFCGSVSESLPVIVCSGTRSSSDLENIQNCFERWEIQKQISALSNVCGPSSKHWQRCKQAYDCI